MHRITRILAVAAVLLVGFAPAPAADDAGGNISCRLDGEASGGQAVGTATCLQADPETHGEFELELVVTLQALEDGSWVDVATEECGATSTQGLAQAQCVTASEGAAGGTVRALLDLVSPKDWAPAIAQPVYQGGAPIQDALASDACDVNELVDTDLTAPDAPWADLCAVTMEHEAAETLETVTVIVHVAGELQLRTDTTSWTARLYTDDCRHRVEVDDSGVVGVADARIVSSCDRLADEPCSVVGVLLADLTGGGCSAGATYAATEVSPLPADAVEFGTDQVRITFRPSVLGGLTAGDLTIGRTITEVSASTTTGIGSRADDSRVQFDGDFAYPTGRTHTLG